MYYVYVLKLGDGTFYIGYSSNLKQRIYTHRQRQVAQTKNSPSFKLVWYAAFDSLLSAIRFEKYLKSSSGFAFRNKHLV